MASSSRSYRARHKGTRPRRRTVVTALTAGLIMAAAGTAAVVTLVSGPAGAASSVVVNIPAGTTIAASKSLTSANGQYALGMNAAGSLVLSAQGQTLWSSPGAVSGSRAVMQGDGNLVVYSAANVATWNSGTVGHPGSYAQVTSTGDLQVLDSTTTYWHTATLNNALTAGHWLRAGQSLVTATGHYVLIMQTDGNLVLYSPVAVWNSRTAGHPGAAAVMQGDGNFVVYSSTGVALWNSATYGTGASTVTNTDDGSISITTPDRIMVFQVPGNPTGTAIVAAASSQRGAKYCYAGGDQNGPTKGRDSACTTSVGFDCSGLALYSVFHATGRLLPHYSGTQFSQATALGGTRVSAAALRPGDLVFFIGADGTTAAPGHVGIYAGNNTMIDAQGSGVPVGVHTLYSGYVGAVRYS